MKCNYCLKPIEGDRYKQTKNKNNKKRPHVWHWPCWYRYEGVMQRQAWRVAGAYGSGFESAR